MTDPEIPWRERWGVHPAADLFPPLSRAELEALAADIKERGLLVPILMCAASGPKKPGTWGTDVLDGRGRLDALELAGLTRFDEDGLANGFRWDVLDEDDDPYAAVIALNAKRRHLTAAQRREAIAKYIAIRPEQSDRQIAALFAVDHKTVGAARRKGVATGEISPVERTIGADGKSRPVVRTPRAPIAAHRIEGSASAATVRTVAFAQPVGRYQPVTRAEIERRAEELEIEPKELGWLYEKMWAELLGDIQFSPHDIARTIIDGIGLLDASVFHEALGAVINAAELAEAEAEEAREAAGETAP